MKYIVPASLGPVGLEASESFDCADAFGYGNFQRGVLFFAVLSMWVLHCHTLIFPLISADVDHWCRPPAGLNISTDEWKLWAVPLDDLGQHSRCTLFANPSDPNDTGLVRCQAWDYDPEFAPTSIVSSWDLVCARAWLIPLANALSMAGALVALTVCGIVADRIGRKLVALGAASTLLIATFGSSFATSYLVYVSTKFVISGSCTTLFIASAVLLVEVSTHRHRGIHVAFSIAAGLTLSDAMFAVASELHHAGWMTRQLLLVSPTALIPLGFLLITESPRWLIARRKFAMAGAIMQAAARANGFRSDGSAKLVARLEGRLGSAPTPSFLQVRDVDSVDVVRRRALTSFCAMFSALFTHYVILLAWAARKTALMKGVTLAANAIACAALLPAFNTWNGKKMLTVTFLLMGTSCIFLSVATGSLELSTGVHSIALAVAEAACFVNLDANFTFLFLTHPAPVRATISGLAFALGRCGGVIAAPLSLLRTVGREDLLFALLAAATFGAAWRVSHIPDISNPDVTLPPSAGSVTPSGHGSVAATSTDSRRELLEGMVKTLDRREPSAPKIKRKRASRKSPGTTRSDSMGPFRKYALDAGKQIG
ncbi:hypothetical protein HPB48_008634 [Haemaphysalis longicornis]|uniref:Uncharacterized protein n=1 Tax=Haemaphysalis longicornis TaxID=44386 RepID=A0A9J6GUJ0_HAELO|nr:hypothetical protein HPB48_008634 [Haemaphysalis longicornis]